MHRTPVNPWPWSLKVGYNQAELIEGATRQLICAGQTSVDGAGNPRHAGDMRAQLTLALDNLEAVLKGGGMGLADIVRLTLYTTDTAALMPNLDLLGQRFGAVGAAPPMTLLGVTALALPPLMVEIEATALR